MLPNFSYVRVKSLQEAVKASSVDGTSLMAGGTDLRDVCGSGWSALAG